MRAEARAVARPGARALVAALVLALCVAAGPPARAGGWTLGGVPCELIPTSVRADVPPTSYAGTGTCGGVRPGAIVKSADSICTLNFLFKGSDGARYIGTAGHCVLGDGPFSSDAGERVWAAGTGPVAYDSANRRIGRFAYAILQDPKDFALIRLDSGVPASARMCWFGGPTASSTSTAAPVLLHYFGNGVAVGDVLPARTAVAPYMGSPHHIYAEGVVVPGDSGGGVIDTKGRAVGVLVTTGLHVGSIRDAGLIGITRLRPQELRAESKLRITLALVTASLAT